MLMNGMNLFPLEKCPDWGPYLTGYFMSGDGSVYSSRSAASPNIPVRLHGSSTPSGRYYTLNKCTYREDDLIRKAKSTVQFAVETGTAGAVEKAPSATVANGRTKVASVAAAEKGYVLASIGPTDRLVFGTDPVLHLTEKTAKEEAARIAALHPGTKIVILKMVNTVRVGVTWE
jgi:hypothetical protein